MCRPMTNAPTPSLQVPRIVASASRPGRSVSNIHSVSRPPPTPNGSSLLWPSAELKPSREMARSLFTMPMALDCRAPANSAEAGALVGLPAHELAAQVLDERRQQRLALGRGRA